MTFRFSDGTGRCVFLRQPVSPWQALGQSLACIVRPRAVSPSSRILAAFPLLFAVQQTLEGVVWLGLTGPLSDSLSDHMRLLASGYLVFAFAVWPIITPLAVGLIEPDRDRRRIMFVSGLIGGLIGLYLLIMVFRVTYIPAVSLGHIVYEAPVNHSVFLELAYAVAVIVPLLVSSSRLIVVFGVVVAIGAAISYFGYAAGRPSVWCFFAATASLILVMHFRQQARGVN